MDNPPVQISFVEIYDIWKKFCQNCEPEPDWQTWYNSFKDVDGIQRKDITFYKNELLNNVNLLDLIRHSRNNAITLKFFEDALVVAKTTREERKSPQNALVELAGEPTGYRWSRNKIIEKLEFHIKNIRDEESGEISF